MRSPDATACDQCFFCGFIFDIFGAKRRFIFDKFRPRSGRRFIFDIFREKTSGFWDFVFFFDKNQGFVENFELILIFFLINFAKRNFVKFGIFF